jgi:hypothetical protein
MLLMKIGISNLIFFALINELFMRILKTFNEVFCMWHRNSQACRSANDGGCNLIIGNLMNNWRKAEDSEFGSVSCFRILYEFPIQFKIISSVEKIEDNMKNQ